MIKKIVCVMSLAIVGHSALAAPHPLSLNRTAEKSQVWGESFPEGEKAIYLRLIESYRKSNLGAVYRFRDLLLTHYPVSIYADNAIYLAGMLDMEKGRLADAIQNFGRVSEKYPKGNKRPAALYAKSMAYAKLNLPKVSRKVLEQLVNEYPGSAESQRAWIDLRLKEKKT